jgi:Thioredoxin like C-terminal domain
LRTTRRGTHFRIRLTRITGIDVDAQGKGAVTGQRLYQLIRQSGPVTDHTFEIRFLDSDVQAYSYSFTFG